MMQTKEDAIQFVTTAIEGHGTEVASTQDYDLEAIVIELRDVAGSWDLSLVEHGKFWEVVEQHKR